MRVTLIAAAADNDVIGHHGAIPWDLPDDLKHFRMLTEGHAVIMGRKTFDSIGRPLPRRRVIVVTRNTEWAHEGCETASSVEEALDRVRADAATQAYVAGGGEIYRAAWPHATHIQLTRVHASPEGDVCFPHVDPEHWHRTARVEHPADERHAVACTFEEWERKAL